jgi:hypothetical protein
MIDEARMVDPSALSPRAAVALLTLQLRATLQRAVEVESQVASIDVDAELWQLRSKLAPLMEDRRRALADDLAAEQANAAEAIGEAHARAEQLVADAQARADAAAARAAEQAARNENARRAAAALAARAAMATPQPTPQPIPRPTPDDPSDDVVAPALETVREPTSPVIFDDPLTDWQPAEPLAPVLLPPPPPPVSIEVPTIIEATAPVEPDARPSLEVASDPLVVSVGDDAAWAEHPPVPTATLRLPAVATPADLLWSQPDPSRSQAMHVVIDADSFAKAFAAALAPVLEAQGQAPTFGYPPAGYVPAQPQAPKKKSFWANAWHPDVLLSGLAMVIVIIVLIAWTG